MHSSAKADIIACYLPQAVDDHSQTCKTLFCITHTLPQHIFILGGDFQANWTGPNAKDANIRNMPYRRWEGPTTPTFISQSRPGQYTCIDHIAIRDDEGLAIQNGPTQTIKVSFLDHCGVLGTASFPLLIPPALVPTKSAITPGSPCSNTQSHCTLLRHGRRG